jgi:hypothetical protein
LERRNWTIGKRKKRKYLEWIISKDPQDRIELRRMQGKISLPKEVLEWRPL